MAKPAKRKQTTSYKLPAFGEAVLEVLRERLDAYEARVDGIAKYLEEEHDRQAKFRDGTKAKLDTLISQQSMTEERKKAEEEAKPIAFGTPVKWNGRDAIYVEHDQGRPKETSHVLLVNFGEHPYLTCQDRSSFTITNP